MSPDKPSRRQFSAGLVALSQKSDRRIEGAIVDDSHLLGHKLRDRQKFASPKQEARVPLVVVGGGMAGLSAAWRLDKKGFRDFVVLELERDAGGNSRYGQNEVSAYPWAAHYLPVPNRSATLVRELCQELGLREEDRWNERHLCHSPQERLFLHGRWQEGLEPETGVTLDHRNQLRRFEEKMAEYSATGEFTIPLENGIKSGMKSAGLDSMSMDQWLREQGFDSPSLQWFVDYSCRDDYGAHSKETSAWAGVHYFASREHDDKGPFTWPEGNGWLVKQLMKRIARYVRTSSMVTRVEVQPRGVRVSTEQSVYLADRLIWAAPTFLLRYVSEQAPDTSAMVYSPWVTANLTLDRMPREHRSELAWDNVIYDSPSLGYVVATHQSLRSQIDRSVWTWYYAFAGGRPQDVRRMLLEKDWKYWKEMVLNDLGRAHPDIRQCVSRIDVMRFGHAMARPVVGWMQSPARRSLASWGDRLALANSDLSGFSIFEEAQYHGVRAADGMLSKLGRG